MSAAWLQLEFTGHWFPSQASQQVVGCQQGHGVSCSMGGTANMGQDHWKGEEEREVRGWFKSLTGALLSGPWLTSEKNKPTSVSFDLLSLLSLSTPFP